MPKSQIFTVPSPSRMMFAGFRSRCTMPCWWVYARAAATCSAMSTMSATGSGWCLLSSRSWLRLRPVQQLHHQVEHAVGLAEVVDDGHPAVLEGRGHPRLAAEPLPQDTGEPSCRGAGPAA